MSLSKEQESRLKNFEYLMHVLDEAEGERRTEEGAFSFLYESSYVRQVVVSPRTRTSIAGLKTFLATEVLGIYDAQSTSHVSYRDIHDQLSGDMSKKYSFYYDFFDDVFDVEKNKSFFLECDRLWSGEEDSRKHVEEGNIWWPYLLMERLREVVWEKLREFFKLCEQETCNGCKKKGEVYFQFIKAVALFEIFLVECIQEKGTEYIENTMALIKTMEDDIKRIGSASKNVTPDMGQEEVMIYMQQIDSGLKAFACEMEKRFHPMLTYIGVFQSMKMEFGISYNAMCYLLMVLEAMNVCGIRMRGIEKTSLKIKGELWEVYERDLEILQNYNKNREKRYKGINIKLEELLKEYGDEEFDESATIYAFMTELCKPKRERNATVLRGLEWKLGYPIYKDLGGED